MSGGTLISSAGNGIESYNGNVNISGGTIDTESYNIFSSSSMIAISETSSAKPTLLITSYVNVLAAFGSNTVEITKDRGVEQTPVVGGHHAGNLVLASARSAPSEYAGRKLAIPGGKHRFQSDREKIPNSRFKWQAG